MSPRGGGRKASGMPHSVAVVRLARCSTGVESLGVLLCFVVSFCFWVGGWAGGEGIPVQLLRLRHAPPSPLLPLLLHQARLVRLCRRSGFVTCTWM